MLVYDKEEPVTDNLISWVFDENSFVPAAKLVGDKSYSILTDHLGTPYEAYDENGQKVWVRELDLYGNAITGDSSFIPFLYQGQYYDEEIGLAYNRFRYYSPESGTYISQDPIRLAEGLAFYGYVMDCNGWIDPWGLFEELTSMAKEISESGDHFFSRARRVVAVGKDKDGNLYSASSNGLDKGQRAKSKELGVEPINSSTMYDTKGKNLHAEEVLMQEVENLEKVGIWPREACGIDEHNCLGQLEDKDIKVEKHNH